MAGFNSEKERKRLIRANIIIATILAANIMENTIEIEKEKPLKNELAENQMIDVSEEIKVECTEELTLEEVKELINNSSLSDEEKSAIINDDYLTDVINIVNVDETARTKIYNRYSDLGVIYEEMDPQGYVYNFQRSIIHINEDIENVDDEFKDTMAHEFVHVNQNNGERCLLSEATAEIISNEYYQMPLDSYTYEVKATKLLLEIIGPNPILQYVYFGDKEPVLNSVRPYLNDNEYEEFTDYYFNTYNDNNENIDRSKYYKITELLSTLHRNMYGDYMVSDPMINAMLNGEKYDRYYFNERFMDEEHSCYYERTWYDCPMEEAIENGDVQPLTVRMAKSGEVVDANTPAQTIFYTVNPESKINGDTVHTLKLVPNPVEPINKKFK